MTTITLWNGRTIPRLGMGTWTIGGPFRAGDQALGWGEVDDGDSVAAIRTAIDLGIRYFDTADVYGAGHAEEVLGRALKGVEDEIVVSTKFGNRFDRHSKQITGPGSSPDHIRSAVEASLSRLAVARIDLVFFHLNDHPAADAGAVFDTLSALRAEGKIDGFGWSTDSVGSAAAFADMDGFVAVQHDMNLFRPARAMLDLAERKTLISVNRQPLAMGLLTGKFAAGRAAFQRTDIRASGPDWLSYFRDGQPAPELAGKLEAIRDLLTADGRTPAQGALAWLWAQSPRALPIPGFRNRVQVEENFGALAKGPLPADAVGEIERLIGDDAGTT